MLRASEEKHVRAIYVNVKIAAVGKYIDATLEKRSPASRFNTKPVNFFVKDLQQNMGFIA